MKGAVLGKALGTVCYLRSDGDMSWISMKDKTLDERLSVQACSD